MRKFLPEKLEGVIDPEDKRKRIGKLLFLSLKRRQEDRGGSIPAQGTLYRCDWKYFLKKALRQPLEPSQRGGLPEKMELKLVEPLRELFKDE